MSQYDCTIFHHRNMTVRLTPAHWFFVYLVHFDSKLGNPAKSHGQAQHYLGSTGNLDARLQLHRTGNGARLMLAVAQAGIDWRVSRLWRFDSCEQARAFERKLKRHAQNPRQCYLCNPRRAIDPITFARQGHRRLAPVQGKRRALTPVPVRFVRWEVSR